MWAVDGQTKKPYMGKIGSVHTLIHNFQNTVFREPQNVLLTYMVVRTAYMQNIK